MEKDVKNKHKKSVIVNMACGLANRMFQYSYYLYLKNLGYNVFVDFYTSAVLPHENVPWNRIFPNAPIRQASKWMLFKTAGGSSLFSKIRRRYFPCLSKVIYMPTAFSVLLPTNEGDSYVNGVFQNAAMADAVKVEVQQAFSFVPFEKDINFQLMQEMQACQSVAIHVRKGVDYQSRIWYQNTCPMEYYREAIEYMRNKLEHPKFYVFADNHAWVKENFKDFEYTLVEGNPPAGWGAHFDMQLMSYCKHNVISNSTYSWWGAFLNKNDDKIVILPKQWFNPASCEESTSEKVQCKGWIAL